MLGEAECKSLKVTDLISFPKKSKIAEMKKNTSHSTVCISQGSPCEASQIERVHVCFWSQLFYMNTATGEGCQGATFKLIYGHTGSDGWCQFLFKVFIKLCVNGLAECVLGLVRMSSVRARRRKPSIGYLCCITSQRRTCGQKLIWCHQTEDKILLLVRKLQLAFLMGLSISHFFLDITSEYMHSKEY